MGEFLVHYGYDIKKKDTIELTKTKRDTFIYEIEGKKLTPEDTSKIQRLIQNMAKDAITHKREQVIYANYHKLEMIEGD